MKTLFLSKKQSFSLIEILVVMTLVSMIAAIAGIQIHKAIHQTRFRESRSLLQTRINNLRKLAKLTHGGATLILEYKGSQTTSWAKGEAIPTNKILGQLHKKEIYPGITKFEVKPLHGSQPNPLAITFYSNDMCYLENTSDRVDELKITSSSGNEITYTIPLKEFSQDNMAESNELYP